MLLIIILIIVAIFVFLDFIPVRFAEVVDASYNNGDFTESSEIIDLLATYSNKTGNFDYPWDAYSSHNDYIIFYIKGNNPYQTLSRRDFYYDRKEWKIDIDFILTGKLLLLEENLWEFDISTWKIVYPVERQSFRKYYAPKSYLTIYDFDWLEVIKSWFS